VIINVFDKVFMFMRDDASPSEGLNLFPLIRLAMERQDELVPDHPNNSNIRCSPQDKRCIQKTLARHPSKSTNQRSNTAREETKAALVEEPHPPPPPHPAGVWRYGSSSGPGATSGTGRL